MHTEFVIHMSEMEKLTYACTVSNVKNIIEKLLLIENDEDKKYILTCRIRELNGLRKVFI